jgi:hypothetical protein
MVVSLTFWVLAAICNACMDTLAHHYYTSIFYKPSNINNAKWISFFNPDISSISAYTLPYTKYKVDAWHLFKSSMIIFLALSITFAWMSGPPLLNIWWYYLGFFILLGIIWNGIFNIFYNHLLLKNDKITGIVYSLLKK